MRTIALLLLLFLTWGTGAQEPKACQPAEMRCVLHNVKDDIAGNEYYSLVWCLDGEWLLMDKWEPPFYSMASSRTRCMREKRTQEGFSD